MRKKIAWITVVGLFGTGPALANVRLLALIGDNMVLQRDAKINLWGWAGPAEVERMAFHGVTATAKANQDGRILPSILDSPEQRRSGARSKRGQQARLKITDLVAACRIARIDSCPFQSKASLFCLWHVCGRQLESPQRRKRRAHG
jgi:hypothetical protein